MKDLFSPEGKNKAQAKLIQCKINQVLERHAQRSRSETGS